MGRVITNTYGQEKTILKHFPYLGASCLVKEAGVSADANGRKIVKAGTPYPANNATCKGLLLHDVDVTYGDATGTYVYEGDIDNKKLTENGVTVSDTAKAKIPRVTFWD